MSAIVEQIYTAGPRTVFSSGSFHDNIDGMP